LPESEAKRPSALISYSHDSAEHERRVLELCNRLRARGIDAFVDQFLAGAPSEGWPLWMERQIEQRDFTLMVCTEAYRRRFAEAETSGIGLGVVWEARILRNFLYENPERHGRIIPVFLEPSAREFVPTVFRGHYYDLSDERGFENLIRHLLREPGAEAGALGPLGPQGARWSAFEHPWMVPDAMRTRYFTGREELLGRLRSQLAERHRAALSGLGGVGKTQAAMQYALQHRADYPDGVFWVNAESVAGLTSGFVEIAQTLHLGAAAGSDHERIVAAVLKWFDDADRWLLILDNVEGREEVRPFVPKSDKGDVIITSRESAFGEFGIARSLEVADLRGDDALHFLLSRSGREDAAPDDRAAAAELASELGHLPLALEQAAAYISETNAAFSAYLQAFRKRRLALIERSAGLVSHDTVAVTWLANFEAVQRASPAAAEVLRTSAFLAPDAIPFELFLDGARALGGQIAEALADADDLEMSEVLRPLARYSLVRSDPKSRSFGVHRLVQEVARTSLAEPERTAYVERAVRGLDAVFPLSEYANWAQCERLIPHIASLAPSIDSSLCRPEIAARTLNESGEYLRKRGRYPEAQPLNERALAIREKALGPDHLEVAESLNDLAKIHWQRGRYAEAQGMHERALAIRAKALGPDHPKLAESLNNLAILHREQGRLAEAQPLHERALAIREKALGPDHPHVARDLNNLGVIHAMQGRFAEAQLLHERALAIREKALGADHPDVAQSLSNVANHYRRQGRYAGAQTLFERVLAICEKAFGPDHHDVAHCLDNLALLNLEQGRYTEAQALFERALATYEKAIGPDHPEIARTLVDFASLLEKQGRNSDAVLLLERALHIKERTLAPDHPDLEKIRRDIQSLRAADASESART
jgi:tetratricopeptide (TPR) repeat protein